MANGVQQNLRVVLLVRSPLAPAWVAELAGVLLAADDFDVWALVVPEDMGTRPANAGPCARSAERLARVRHSLRLGGGAPAQEPFSLIDLRQVAPALRVHTLRAGNPISSEAPADVAVAAGTWLARGAYAARRLHFPLGIWYSPQLDSPNGRVGSASDGEAERWHELEHVAVTVRSVMGASVGERLVMVADVPLESVYAEQNRAEAAWGAASLVLAALEHARGDSRAAPAAPPADSSARESPPDEDARSGIRAPSECRPRAASYARRVAAAAVRRVAFKRQWLLAYHFGDAHSLASTDDTRLIVPPVDRYWADPHVVFAGGEYHVFFEEFSYRSGRGHIATMRLGASGPLDKSRVALASDCHLSYPFVFAFEGEWYMIPESSEARRIDVYHAKELPLRWTLATTLMHDVSAVDTTVVEHEGRWWLFTTIRRLGGSSPLTHLYLFSADSPLSGAWEPHPKNPIASGSAGARAAGSIIRRDHRLIRPSQDSRVSYGGRVQLSEIVALTRDEFRERPAGSLEPNKAGGFIGLHTVAQAQGLTVVDLCRWRTRF